MSENYLNSDEFQLLSLDHKLLIFRLIRAEKKLKEEEEKEPEKVI